MTKSKNNTEKSQDNKQLNKTPNEADNECLKFDLKVSELSLKDLLIGNYRSAFKIYHKIYSSLQIDLIASRDKANLDYHLKGMSNFTYGEVSYEHFLALLHFLAPAPNEIFYDLGCGSGKPVAIAALNFPQLAACKGVEFLPGLCQVAKE